MRFVEPAIFILANTEKHPGIEGFLKSIGAEGWTTDAESDGEFLIEVAGKTCYRAFNLDKNPNLTRVRESDNHAYISNILDSKHGSVLEHVNVTFGFVNVSRVFTHELVRHRIASYSQESLRFVRLTDLGAYYPDVFRQPFLNRVNEHLRSQGKPALDLDEKWLRREFQEVFEYLEQVQQTLAARLRLDHLDSFSDKKKLTSAMRRLAPEGLATIIIGTANLRQWRHEVQLRTNRHAEEEIRFVFERVYTTLVSMYPNVFQDAITHMVDGHLEVMFQNEKV